tara:strand:+ start:317 stop:577 length:261 start_codon:yes stop_codon:yes gene_type:complete
MKFYSYIIASKIPFPKTYVGWTTNLEKRLGVHNLSKGAKSTRGRKWSLVYYLSFNSKRKAMQQEYKLKKDKKFRKKIKLKFIHDGK